MEELVLQVDQLTLSSSSFTSSLNDFFIFAGPKGFGKAKIRSPYAITIQRLFALPVIPIHILTDIHHSKQNVLFFSVTT